MTDLDRLLELAQKTKQRGGQYTMTVGPHTIIELIERVKEAERKRDYWQRGFRSASLARTDALKERDTAEMRLMMQSDECIRQLEEAEARLRAAEEVINGFRWLGNNLHNIKADPERFEDLYRAALDDVERYDDKAAKE